MKRLGATAALTVMAALALPAPPASACSYPYPQLALPSDRVGAGTTVRVSGEVVMRENGLHPPCDMVPPIPPPTEEPSPEPAETPSAEPTTVPTPLVSLPPLVPVAYGADLPADPGLLVHVAIAEWRDWDDPDGPFREIAVLAPNPKVRLGTDLYTWSFAGRVTIPRDTRPGRYHLSASQPSGVNFGHAEVTVVPGLPDTGGHTSELVRLAGLSLVTGAATLVAARSRVGRRSGDHP